MADGLIVGSAPTITGLDAKTWDIPHPVRHCDRRIVALLFQALQLGDVNKVVPIDKSSTILTIILALIFLGEPISWLKAAAVVLIGIGTFMMIERRLIPSRSRRKKSWLLYAVLSAVFCVADLYPRQDRH